MAFLFFILLLTNSVIAISFEKLTVLSSPIGKDGWFHEGVMDSLKKGLIANKISFNCNPKSIEELGDVVLVTSSVEALQEAILWKRQGRIKYLLAGPNVLANAHSGNDIIISPELDCYFHPSAWVVRSYEEDISEIKHKNRIWFAGVDESFWVPSGNSKNKKTALIYWKDEQKNFIDSIRNLVEKNGWDAIVIKYGSYTKTEYKKALDISSVALFISKSESQGIALAESWAMNVPTFVWNPQKPFTWCGKIYKDISSCPYLTDSTGKEWQTLDQLDILLSSFTLLEFSSREWVLENMTDAISVKKLVEIIESLYKKEKKLCVI